MCVWLLELGCIYVCVVIGARVYIYVCVCVCVCACVCGYWS